MNEDSELNEYLRDEIQRLKDASLQLCERAEEQKKYMNELENRLRALWDKYNGDMKHYMERIKRLEEVGERLWVKARSISVKDTYDRHGNEVTVHELNPETVVLDYDHGDGITAGNMVELLEALKEWKKAKETKL